MKRLHLPFILLLTLPLSHCLTYDLSRAYIQQGNILPAHKVQRLKVGMSRKDVAHLLGSSLINDLFNPRTLNYAYTYRKGAKPMTIKYVALTFDGNRLVKIEHKP